MFIICTNNTKKNYKHKKRSTLTSKQKMICTIEKTLIIKLINIIKAHNFSYKTNTFRHVQYYSSSYNTKSLIFLHVHILYPTFCMIKYIGSQTYHYNWGIPLVYRSQHLLFASQTMSSSCFQIEIRIFDL